ncbi:TPA: hypothetical protein N2Q78_004556 [Citrobacter freundii]|nr:hypothetical protein [Citrobacter freundii]
MINFTKEKLVEYVKGCIEHAERFPGVEIADKEKAIFEIALAALTAPQQEPVAWIVHARAGDQLTTDGNYVANAEGIGGIHSTALFTTPPASVVPDGYVLVPIIPTDDMIINGFEAELREEFSDPEALKTYEKMSGCELAAHRAKLCWAAMIAAAPQQERKI